MGMFRLFSAIAIFCAIAFAQPASTPITVRLNTQGDGYGCCGSESGDTTGTLFPFPGTIHVSFSLEGSIMQLTLYFNGDNSSGIGDILKFSDPASQLVGDTFMGSAQMDYGTGVFQGAVGSLQYSGTCVVVTPQVSCESMDGVPLEPVQSITLTGTGALAVPAAAAGLLSALALGFPKPSQDAILAAYAPGSVVLNLDFSPPSGSGQARHIQAAAASAPTSLTITPPWQPVAMTYSVAATCPGLSIACWLSVPAASGSIPAFTKVPISVNLNPPISSPGVLPGNIALTLTPANSSPVTQNLPMNAIVTPLGPFLSLSQTGLQFQVASGAAATASQTVSVSNPGTGSLAFTTSVSTLSGGNWLSVTGGPGNVAATASTNLTVQANPANLVPGLYFGRVDVNAPGVFDAPQSIIVALNVLGSAVSAAPSISPTGIVFVATVGSNPVPQRIQVTNPSGQTAMIAASTEPGAFFTPQPTQGSILAGQSAEFTMTANTAALAAGVYRTPLTLQPVGGEALNIPVTLVVKPAGKCTPTQLLPVFTSLLNGFTLTAGLPVPLQAQVIDDCGTALTNGVLTAAFTGDPAMSLVSTGNGYWSGTWTPILVAGGGAAVTLAATSFTSGVNGGAGLSGTLVANNSIPVVTTGGVVSAASLQLNAPLAPGSFLSIFGANLADGPTSAASLPLPTKLGTTQVLLGGKPLPLNFAGPTQINAIVPYGTPLENLQQLMVVHGSSYSPPQTLAVTDTQPAMFTQNQSGSGPGIVVVIKPDGTQFLNTATAPASAGDVLVLYCTGLGAVSPPSADGAAASSSTLSRTTQPVSVTIGGQSAPILFSGLAPGFAGLYQVNVTVPTGIAPGTQVPLVVSAGALSSPPVTVAIQ